MRASIIDTCSLFSEDLLGDAIPFGLWHGIGSLAELMDKGRISHGLASRKQGEPYVLSVVVDLLDV